MEHSPALLLLNGVSSENVVDMQAAQSQKVSHTFSRLPRCSALLRALARGTHAYKGPQQKQVAGSSRSSAPCLCHTQTPACVQVRAVAISYAGEYGLFVTRKGDRTQIRIYDFAMSRFVNEQWVGFQQWSFPKDVPAAIFVPGDPPRAVLYAARSALVYVLPLDHRNWLFQLRDLGVGASAMRRAQAHASGFVLLPSLQQVCRTRFRRATPV